MDMGARTQEERESENERRVIVTEEWCQKVLEEAGAEVPEDRLERVLNEAFGYWGGGDPVEIGLRLRILQACEAIEGTDLTSEQRKLLDRQWMTFEKYAGAD